MGSTVTGMPIVVIFERHWDEAPRELAKKLLPELADECYDTVCLEAPQDYSEQEIVSSFEAILRDNNDVHSEVKQRLEKKGFENVDLYYLAFKKLVDLMEMEVSTKHFIEIAEKIKSIPSKTLLQEIFNNAIRLSFSIKGVDIDDKDLRDTMAPDPSIRIKAIETKEDIRIKTIAQNLFKLYIEKKGVVLKIGASHAENLIKQFKELNIHDRTLYYFPYSNKNYPDLDVYDEIFGLPNDVLKQYEFCLPNESDCELLKKRIITEIKSKNTQYKREIVGGNSHSIFLSKFFHKDFRAFERPGYHVDALLDIGEADDIKEVVEKLRKVNIQTYTKSLIGRTYLVVSEVNTREVADNIRRLK
jgi:hypothetical protein